MQINRLEVRNFRNIVSAKLLPSKKFNLIVGDNASGKTSLLEAIYIASIARSFRSKNTADVIRNSQTSLTVFAEVQADTGFTFNIGVEKTSHDTVIKCSGKRIRVASDLALRLPVILICPDSHGLLTGGPGERRRLLDWALFHVEPDYLEIWKKYYKALRQRNALLKSRVSDRDLNAWNGTLCESADLIHHLRARYITKFCSVLKGVSEEAINQAPDIQYLPGWDTGLRLENVLLASSQKDRKQGYTTCGPHRAEISVSINRKPAIKTWSSGQLKLYVAAFLLAKAVIVKKETGKNPLLLIDDLAAELDLASRALFMSMLKRIDAQVFVTTTDRNSIPVPSDESNALFHVEQGGFTKVLQ